MAQQFSFFMKGCTKTFPTGKTVLKDIYLSFYYGAKIGVIGTNGSGKSTLLKIMAGVDTNFSGEAHTAAGITKGYLPQEPELDTTKTVREIAEEGVASVKAVLKRFDEINSRLCEDISPEEMEKLCDEQAVVQEKIEAMGAWELDSKVEQALSALRCPEPDTPVKNLSGGEKRRVALCRLLLQAPDILLLDEPTNHLDAETVAWLEHHLQTYKGTVILVTHDRYFLDNVVKWILELDRGEGIPFEGNYSAWLAAKHARLAGEERQENRRQKAIERELEWINASPKARQAKSKARIQAYDQLVAQEAKTKVEDVEIYIPPGPRLGDLAFQTNDLTKAFGDQLLFEKLNIKVPAGAVVGIIGANGAGKTTFFRILTGQQEPTAGNIKWSDSAKIAYVDQSRDTLAADKAVWDEVGSGSETILLGNKEVNTRNYVARFGFTGADQQKLVGNLSGGERNRVHLAKLLKSGSNVLLLDEPTNDLDVNTLRALEEAVEHYSGCVMVISHDRYFLDRIATHILAFEGDAQITWWEGDYQSYAADKRKRMGADADVPKRIKYRKFTR